MAPSPSTGKTRTIVGVIALGLTIAVGAGGSYGAGLATAGLSAEVLAETVASEPASVETATPSRAKPAVD